MAKYETWERFRSPDKKPSNADLITELIRTRWLWTDLLVGKREKTKEVPGLAPLPSLDILFGTPDLWMKVDKTRFISRRLVEELLYRLDGEEKEQNSFSVAIANRKDHIKDRWGTEPLAVWGKQRFQYWDHNFVQAFFASIQYPEPHPWTGDNTLAYGIVENISHKQLKQIKGREERHLAYVIRTSREPIYLEVRQKWHLPAMNKGV